MKSFFRLTLAGAFVAFAAATASAQVTQTLAVTAAVAARASLTLSVGALNFPDTDPDTNGGMIDGSAVITVTARSRTSAGNAVTLTVSAPDLTSGSDTIAASQISWTATGDLSSGTLSNAAVTLVNSTNSGLRTGDMTFQMVNSWSYAIGNYTTTVTYTLSAP